MTDNERERGRRFDALFAAYSSDVVAYCSWRAGWQALHRFTPQPSNDEALVPAGFE